jgi:predicted RNA-binding protein with PUA-like domain
MADWILKSEPDVFGLGDLLKRPNQEEFWDGVRNYQARNLIRDVMKKGDRAFFYHSNASPAGIVGIMFVVSDPKPDPSAEDPNSPYFDERWAMRKQNLLKKGKAPEPNPWYGIRVGLPQVFPAMVPLDVLKTLPTMGDHPCCQRGNRLSVMPLSPMQAAEILQYAQSGLNDSI